MTRVAQPGDTLFLTHGSVRNPQPCPYCGGPTGNAMGTDERAFVLGLVKTRTRFCGRCEAAILEQSGLTELMSALVALDDALLGIDLQHRHVVANIVMDAANLLVTAVAVDQAMDEMDTGDQSGDQS